MPDLRTLFGNLRQAIQQSAKATHTKALSPSEFKEVMYHAAQRLRPMVTRFFTQNFTAAGLKSHTGTMLETLEDVDINIAEARGTLRLVFTLRKGTDYEKGGNVFKAIAALKYGAVRGPREMGIVRDTVTGRINFGPNGETERMHSVLGAKAKRAIKRAAHGGKPLTDREKKSIERGVHGKNVERRGVSLSEVSVTKPHFPLFSFTDAQQEQLNVELAKQMNAVIAARNAKR